RSQDRSCILPSGVRSADTLAAARRSLLLPHRNQRGDRSFRCRAVVMAAQPRTLVCRIGTGLVFRADDRELELAAGSLDTIGPARRLSEATAGDCRARPKLRQAEFSASACTYQHTPRLVL